MRSFRIQSLIMKRRLGPDARSLKPFIMMMIMSSFFLVSQAAEKQEDVRGWADFTLGMAYEKAIERLQKSDKPWLRLRTEVDSEILEERELYTVELKPTAYITEGFLQFNQNKRLYLVRVTFDAKYFSYLSLKDRLQKKYGSPTEVTFEKVLWQKNQKRLSLDRKRTVRYMDMRLFSKKSLPSSEADKIQKQTVEEILESL